jgi:resuscitation-promoting factor RpfB
MLAQYGWDSGQFSCLDPLWTHESGWNVYAENPSSGAYGIPQALPGDKMASAGPDWRTNPATQIRWGLTYIQGRYGSPCAAWSHEQGTGWY